MPTGVVIAEKSSVTFTGTKFTRNENGTIFKEPCPTFLLGVEPYPSKKGGPGSYYNPIFSYYKPLKI